MSDHTEFLPAFLVNLRRVEGLEPYVVSCSMVGEVVGFSGLVRRFRSKEDFTAALIQAGIQSERYESAVIAVDQVQGQTKQFSVNLNEAQKLSLIHTDSTE